MAKSETLQKVNALIKGVPLKEIIETAETVVSIIPIPGLKIVIKILKVLLIATPTASSVLTKSAQTVKQREDANKEAFDRMWSIACTDNHITEDEFANWGVNIVIYANHLLRSAYPAMVHCAESILEHGRCKEASEEYCMPIKEILTLIPGTKQ